MNALACILLAAAPAAADDVPDRAALEKNFQETMANAVLTGSFTVDGKPDAKSERYEIGAVTNQGNGIWAIAARIQYGENDVTVPVIVEVKWAGDTPVITLDQLTIPGLGTFDARVLVHRTGTEQARYAGTWQHGKVGGCLFGTVDPKGKQK